MNTETNHIYRVSSPFDDSATERHKRMGLLDEYGEVNKAAVEKMGQLHAGLFYDQLCDTSDNCEHIAAVCRGLIGKAEHGDARMPLGGKKCPV